MDFTSDWATFLCVTILTSALFGQGQHHGSGHTMMNMTDHSNNSMPDDSGANMTHGHNSQPDVAHTQGSNSNMTHGHDSSSNMTDDSGGNMTHGGHPTGHGGGQTGHGDQTGHGGDQTGHNGVVGDGGGHPTGHDGGTGGHGGGHGNVAGHYGYFHLTVETVILFQKWTTENDLQMVYSCLGILAVAIIYEGFKVFREYLLSRSHLRIKKTASKSMCSGMCFGMHIVQSLLHIIQVVLSYFLMLVFMTFNVYLCISVAVGSGIGYFLFRWKSPNIGYELDHCH